VNEKVKSLLSVFASGFQYTVGDLVLVMNPTNEATISSKAEKTD